MSNFFAEPNIRQLAEGIPLPIEEIASIIVGVANKHHILVERDEVESLNVLARDNLEWRGGLKRSADAIKPSDKPNVRLDVGSLSQDTPGQRARRILAKQIEETRSQGEYYDKFYTPPKEAQIMRKLR